MLFSIKGFDDNGKNGVGQTFQQSADWKLDRNSRFMDDIIEKKPNPGRRWGQLLSRERTRFFNQVEHQTANTLIGNKYFFTK